jgi:hypothetical protein
MSTCTFTVDTVPPSVGTDVQIGLGTLDPSNLLFGGEVQSIDHSYVDTAQSPLWVVRAVDYTFTLNKRRPFGSWTNTSATIIAQYVVATFAPGFTANHVQVGLPAISINFDGSADFMTCLRAIATAISTLTQPGFAKVDYSKDVHLFLTETSAAPDPVDNSHPPLNDPTVFAWSSDLSQIRTRDYGKGHGETTPCDVAVSDTILPVADAVMFTPLGGQAIASRTADGAQSQILTYAGVQLGSGGALVGPGASPTVAPNLAAASGTGLGTGVYQYAYTDVTAAGESLPSPIGTVTTGPAVSPPPASPSATHWLGSGTYFYELTFVTAAGETYPSSPYFAGAFNGTAYPLDFVTGPAGTTARNIYRTVDGGGTFLLLTTINNNTMTTFLDDRADGTLGAAVVTARNQVSVTGIAVGQSPTTSRKVYRTAVGGSQLKLVTTIGDNTTTAYADSTADGSLGANAPVTDTSGLTSGVAGMVLAGSTSLLTSGAGPFAVNGGWALVGAQALRYTRISGNTLAGIPASGPGAIAVSVGYLSQIVPSPALTGINANNGIPFAIAKGSKVNLWVQRDDLSAQAALAALEGGDGVREYTITDERMAEATIAAVCDADLAIFSRPIVSVSYQTRDPKTRSGATVHIDTTGIDGVNGIVGDFVIQSVEITFDGPALMPRYTVHAASAAFTLADLLRKVVIAG